MSTSPARSTSEAHVVASDPARYLRMLCKHWRHSHPVTYDETHGRIELSSGLCELDAVSVPGKLKIDLTAVDEEALARLEDVVARHLERFALKETLEFNWMRPGAPA